MTSPMTAAGKEINNPGKLVKINDKIAATNTVSTPILVLWRYPYIENGTGNAKAAITLKGV
ncbi:hypothetical protein AMI01nite_47040 [Aneurinibacillus migulanus]|nr:hypothetical protein AMI01nite_47040 [Aneurinibacillus migulanus]